MSVIKWFVAGFLGVGAGSFLFADFMMEHTLIFEVGALNQIGQILGPSPVFSLKGGVGSTSTIVNTYSISTNEVNKKICGFLDNNMPKGTQLFINMAPPSGARSMGMQALSATPVDLVIEISKVAETELALTYTFTTTPQAGLVPGATRVVFFTLTDG